MNRRFRLLPALLLTILPLPSFADSRPLPLGDLMAGEFARQQGDYATSARHYLLAALASGDPRIAARATETALLAGHDRLAARALRRWRLLEPDALPMHAAAVTLALREGEHESAMEEAAAMLARAEDGGWVTLLDVLAQARGDEAVIARSVVATLFRQALAPDDLQAWLQLAGLARRLDDSALSARIEAAALARFPDDPRGRVLQASRLRQDGQAEEAKAVLRALLEAPPLPPDLRSTAARELAQAGDPAAAAALLARGPQNDVSYSERARWLILGGDRDGLLALYREVRRAPGDARPTRKLLLGHLAEALMRWSEAEAWYAGVDSGEGRDLAVTRRARVLAEMGRLPAALELLDALQQNRDADGERVRDSHLLEAELLIRAGRADDALKALDAGLEVFEGDPVLLYARGMEHERTGRIDAALADFRRILDELPDHAHALNAYAYALAQHRGDFAAALPLLQRAHRVAPTSVAIQDSLGWVLVRLGRVEEGLELLRQAWSAGPDPEIAAHLGEALWRLGRKEEARSIWAAGRAVDADNPVLTATMLEFER
ncbi:tetratricopeptide repeat protein [Arenimonas composti]|uniref:Uncharacterized protein n=1 Tax=Arenimonas composti TR7-09 = DSM 18010 TaxID=1121013 RepID=A0A091C341_9GAMM|nr:tetratricopeptide repeat protein [Arenimonas composti]KFN51050.1 hypothetical protein P873_03900 [Arenimonas composti TR7-09 = DSM 18010]